MPCCEAQGPAQLWGSRQHPVVDQLFLLFRQGLARCLSRQCMEDLYKMHSSSPIRQVDLHYEGHDVYSLDGEAVEAKGL